MTERRRTLAALLPASILELPAMNPLLSAAIVSSVMLAPLETTTTSGAGASLPSSSMAASRTVPANNEKYVLTGDLSALFVSGEIVIYTLTSGGDSGSASSGSTGMSGMSGMSGMASTTTAGPGTNLVATAKLIEGQFRVEGDVANAHPVYFHISEGLTHHGMRMGQVKGQIFIVEPGALTMEMDANYKWMVRGHYNDAVINVWKDSAPYRTARAEMAALYAPGAEETDPDARGEKAVAIQKTMFAIESAGRKRVANIHPDLLARQLAITTSTMFNGWEPDAVRGILQEDPDHTWARNYLAEREARQAKLEREGRRINVGDYAMFFDAHSLDDEPISLWNVCADNRYVLLEFWASWCGPCRSEIPHLKKAYTTYGNKGFEIFSFTIDKDKAAWAKASTAEDLPWIDAGYGEASQPKKLYQVTGVPNNYLIDCRTGKVIAKDLRGNDLDRKLKDLFQVEH